MLRSLKGITTGVAEEFARVNSDLLGDFTAHVGQTVGVVLPADEYLEPLFTISHGLVGLSCASHHEICLISLGGT